MKLKTDNCSRYWFWFVGNNQEDLYYIISSMIDDKLKEVLPQIIQEEMRQYSVNIQTTINGKNSSDLKGIIIDEIMKDF